MEALLYFSGMFFIMFGLCTNSAEVRKNKKMENTFVVLGLLCFLFFIISLTVLILT